MYIQQAPYEVMRVFSQRLSMLCHLKCEIGLYKEMVQK